MRIVRHLLAFAALTASLTAFAPKPAAAQQPARLACDGTYNIVRVSEIKPGMMSKFLEAVAAQQAWYKKAGTPDQIAVMRVIDRDPSTKAASYSETTALTTHTHPADSAQPPAHDAGYDAFVALYRESSTIKSEYFTCMAR